MKKDYYVKIQTYFLKLWITFSENVLSYHYPMRKSVQLIRPRRLTSLDAVSGDAWRTLVEQKASADGYTYYQKTSGSSDKEDDRAGLQET